MCSFLEVVPVEDIMRHIIWLMEGLLDLLRQSSKKLGKQVETNFFVVDLENFSIRQLYSWKVVTLLTDLIKAYEGNYPEILEKAFVINAPGFFPILWKLVRPFLTQRTVAKVAIYGTDGWKAALLERHDPDAFPQHWGGNMVGPDGDPRCTHLICPGGELPDSYREALAKSRLTRESGATLHHIGRLSRWELPVQVSRSGEQLSWSFQTASGDLAFGLRYESPFGGSVAEYLIEPQRLSSCSLCPEQGRLVCEKPGNYVLEFDNSYSWVTAKTLAYIVEVLPPSEEEEEASCL
ncbi:SEC14-like protein 2 [Haemaphysalis longicornis]